METPIPLPPVTPSPKFPRQISHGMAVRVPRSIHLRGHPICCDKLSVHSRPSRWRNEMRRKTRHDGAGSFSWAFASRVSHWNSFDFSVHNFHQWSLSAKDQDGMLNSINNLLLLSYNLTQFRSWDNCIHCLHIFQRLPPKLGPGYQEGWRTKCVKRHETWALLQVYFVFLECYLLTPIRAWLKWIGQPLVISSNAAHPFSALGDARCTSNTTRPRGGWHDRWTGCGCGRYGLVRFSSAHSVKARFFGRWQISHSRRIRWFRPSESLRKAANSLLVLA